MQPTPLEYPSCAPGDGGARSLTVSDALCAAKRGVNARSSVSAGLRPGVSSDGPERTRSVCQNLSLNAAASPNGMPRMRVIDSILAALP